MRDYEHEDERRASRKERKRKSLKDRSKYKKTDLDKQKKEAPQEGQPLGRVLAIKSQEIVVEHEGKLYSCTLKGSLKKEKARLKNLITVGDFVSFNLEGHITAVAPRKTYLSRADNLSQRQEQLIAANIDAVLITVSIATPPLKPALIDRYVIASQKGGMQPAIVINKIDLLEAYPEEKVLFEELVRTYLRLHIPIFAVSTKTGEGLAALQDFMRNKSSVFSGQSGSGKSSLINALTGIHLPTGDLAKKTYKGMHTTTSTKLIPLTCGGFCIDTPGVRSFGLWDLSKHDIEAYFDEIEEMGRNCRFRGCSHTEEEECAVKKAVEEGLISPLRYESYVRLITAMPHEKR